jgi:tripartite-type tricarboxylate transporter receptor subunit TctC
MAEQGFKDMVHSEWFAFFLPAKTPPEIVNALNAALKTALNSKEVLEGLTTFGLEAMHSSPAELAELLRKDTAKWGPIVKQVGFTADS